MTTDQQATDAQSDLRIAELERALAEAHETIDHQQSEIRELRRRAAAAPQFAPAAGISANLSADIGHLGERYFRRLFEWNSIGVFFWDRSGAILDANQTFLNLVGYSQEDLTSGRVRCACVTAPEYFARDEWTWAEMAVRGVSAMYEKQFVRRDGQKVSALVGAVAFPQDNQRSVCFVFDTTGHKAVQEQLAASELRFREFMDHSPAIAFMKDELGRKTYVNQEYQRLYGPAREVLGKNDFETHPLAVAQRLHETDRHVLDTGELVHTVEEVPTPDGLLRKWLVYKFRLIDPQGGRQLCGVGLDITAQLLAQAELARARDELERRVEQRTAKLLESNAQLQSEIVRRESSQAELRRDRQFLRRWLDLQERERRMVVNEIHDGLLQDVIGAHLRLQACLHACHENASPDALDLENSLRFLSRAVNEGRRLISDMRPLIIDEQGIVAAIQYLVAEHHGAGSTAVTFNYQVNFQRLLPIVEGNLFRIVQEALTNARLHSQADAVQIELTEQDGQVILTVSDDGIGFDPQAVGLEHFGLRGIQRRAQLFGGTTLIDSQPGRGTRIRVELPLEPDDSVMFDDME